MNKINYQKKLEEKIEIIKKEGQVPSLLLHSCCGPCSSYCIEFLSNYFNVTVFYYNPNIYPDEEYLMRVKEQQRFIEAFSTKYPVNFIEGDFDKDRYYHLVKGFENEPERGARCEICFNMRLMETAKKAKDINADYFSTTLTISPLKDANLLNSIGEDIGKKLGINWLPSDFKKNNGYKRSTEISKEYNMYRQDYCGCVFSYNERQKQKKDLEE